MSTFVPLAHVQVPTTSPTATKRWRPGPFENMPGDIDRTMLDQALKVIYEHSYTLEQTSARTVVNGSAVAAGAIKVPATGVVKAFATGLKTVSSIVVSVDSALAPTNLWATAQPSTTTPGAIDVAVFQPTSSGNNTPVHATVSSIVRWHAYGT